MLNMFADAYANNEKAVADNAQAETQNFDDPEYGLVPNKPVYTQGVGGSKQYLSGLKSSLGEELAWNRRGSTSVSGVNGMIDIYDNPTTIHVSLTTLHDCLFLTCIVVKETCNVVHCTLEQQHKTRTLRRWKTSKSPCFIGFFSGRGP